MTQENKAYDVCCGQRVIPSDDLPYLVEFFSRFDNLVQVLLKDDLIVESMRQSVFRPNQNADFLS